MNFKNTELGIIPENWKVVNLEENLESLIDYRGKTPKKSHDGIITLSAKSVKMGEIDYSKAYFISKDTYQKFMVRGFPKRGDILLTTEAPLGCIAKLDRDDISVAQRLLTIRGKKDILDNDYLMYYLSSKIGQHQLHSRATGSTVQGIKRSEFKKVLLILPNITTQRNISKILSELDSKIGINQQINQTLEEMAQGLFKSWFVDFEPVLAKMVALESGGSAEDATLAAMQAISGKSLGELIALKSTDAKSYHQLETTANLFPSRLIDSDLGDIPEGWEVSNIDNVCEFQNGYALKSKEMCKSIEDTYKVFKMGGIKKGGGLNKAGTKDYYEKSKCKNLDRYLIKKGDLLMCMTDMKNNVALLGHTALMDVDNEYILNQRVGLLRTKNINKANYPFLYILTNSEPFLEDLRSRANSGVQVNLSTKEIKETKFLLPDEKVHIAFDEIVKTSQEQIFSLEAAQETLTQLRDTLLPKLLSGEIDVSEVA